MRKLFGIRLYNQAVGFAWILIDILHIRTFFSSFVFVQIIIYEAQVELVDKAS
jgi:hypothetical protein